MGLPHNLRLRPDLVIQLQDPTLGTWVVKDPVSLRFYIFGSDERFIMDRLTGRHTLDEIIGDFARERAPKRLTIDRLQAFLAMLHRNGLACSDALGQGQLLLARAADERWRENMLGWSNLLAIRIPGFNPDVVIDRLYGAVRWCFSWWFLALAALMCLAAVGVIVGDWSAFRAQWPQLQEFVSGRNLIWLGVALAVTKCLHELAHALTCRHFGGRCHEMGIILLVFVPCLYCNVTDAWMLRSRRRRIAISAAGMLMEACLAALAVLLWRYTQPGVLNAICMNIIVVCGVSTFLFNGNPLLKYDGYYILSDLLGVPNLWQESRALLRRKLGNLFLKVSDSEQPLPDRYWLLIGYAVASTVYRVCLTVGILLFLYRALRPKGMELFVLAVGLSLLIQNAVVWSGSVTRWWKNPLKFKQLDKRAPPIFAAVLLLLIAAMLLVPVPTSILAPAVLQPRDAVKVFVTSPGVVMQAVEVGTPIQRGGVLAVLENAELHNLRLIAESELARSQARVRTLQLRIHGDQTVAAQLAVAQEIQADFAEQCRLRDKEFDSLTITAPISGVVLPAPVLPAAAEEDELPYWAGSPLERENLGCYLERGTLLCLVGDPDKFEAVVLVDELDLPYVNTGQNVRLQAAHALAKPLAGKIVEIAEVNTDTAPPELVSQHEVVVHQSAGRGSKPIRTLYQARVEITGSEVALLAGARGTARISVQPQTVAEKLFRWARRTFALEPKS